LSRFQKLVGYGVGDFGLNIYWQTLSLFLVFWYTNVVGIDPKIAGLIFFIGMAWDAISDPIMASLSERVNTRFGTYRPFILFGSIFTAFAFILLFWVPPFEGSVQILILIGACLIFRTSYTLVAVPYSAMASRITYSSVERADFSGVRVFFAFVGLLAVSLFMWPVVGYFTASTGSEELAFQYTAACGGAIAVLALLTCFAFTRELPLPRKTVRSEKVWAGIYKNVATNRALQVLLFIILLETSSVTCMGITLIYYIEAHQGDFAPKEVLYTAFAVASWIFVPVWTIAIRKWGRKKIWILTTLIYVAVAAHMMFGPMITIYGIPVHILIFSCCKGAQVVIFWALIPDCVEYGQVDGGFRSEAGVFGSVLITQKLSGGLMGFVVGFVLSAFGISKDIAMTDTVANNLTMFIAFVPAVLLALTIIPILLLPMGRDTHKRIVDRLQTEGAQQ
jgi:GPH family glycoside/pentoside/hexuronide:cation symporter